MWSDLMGLVPWWGFVSGLASFAGRVVAGLVWRRLRSRPPRPAFHCPGCRELAWKCVCGGSG